MTPEQFFESVARVWFFHPELREYLVENGISPEMLPISRGALLIQDFERRSLETGEHRARVDMLEQFKSLVFLDIPLAKQELKFSILKNIAYGRAAEATERLRQNPELAFEICQDIVEKQVAGKASITIRTPLKGLHASLAAKKQEGVALVSIPGWSCLSEAIGGFNPGRLTMITAGTGKGKTTLAINLALSALEVFPVVYINMELEFNDMVFKIMMAKGRFTAKELRDLSFQEYQFNEALEKLNKGHDFFITDGTKWKPLQLSAEIRSKAKLGVKLFIVDYDQKIEFDSKEDEWRLIQRTIEFLEELAKQHSIHIIILSQGNDDGDPKASKRSIQSVSTLLHLRYDEKKFLLEARKNRWGEHGARVFLDHNLAQSHFKESRDQAAQNAWL